MSSSDRGVSESGISVYPKMPLPKRRDSHPSMPPRRSGVNKMLIGAIGGAALGGIVIGALLRPAIAPDSRIGAAETKAAEAEKAATALKQRVEGLDKDVEKANTAKKDVEAKLAEAEKAQTKLAETAADAEKRQKDLEAAKQKLANAAKGVANINVEGDTLHVVISDSLLFPANTDALTDRGKQVLGKLASVLKDMTDKHVMVQGHTDDRPVPVVQVRAAPPPPPKKGGKAAPAPPPPPPPRIPTNWELSALRALAVVHYLQDVAKLGADRLGAEAFSQYRPVSRTNKAANRRIELVLSPKTKR
jgi:flagellar motor protein MotB